MFDGSLLVRIHFTTILVPHWPLSLKRTPISKIKDVYSSAREAGPRKVLVNIYEKAKFDPIHYIVF
jgi:hypothetical protein